MLNKILFSSFIASSNILQLQLSSNGLVSLMVQLSPTVHKEGPGTLRSALARRVIMLFANQQYARKVVMTRM